MLTKKLRDYEARFGPLSQSNGARATLAFPHFPIAGNIDRRDMLVNKFFDHDLGSQGILDWDCSEFTYDGHRGTDTQIKTFDEQDRGVPIYAAYDGVVVATHDGEFDRHTTLDPNAVSNMVTIDHGSGVLGKYWHMKNGSVAATVNQQVVAGEQIGMAGSSGYSNGPHLHFQVEESGQAVDPWAGSCSPGTSWWENQIPMNRSLIVLDHLLSYEDPGINGGPPYSIPRSGQFAFTDSRLYCWFMVGNLPVNSTWRLRLFRPNGTLARLGNVWNFGNTSVSRAWWLSFWVDHAELHTLAGTWRLEVEVNGVVVFNDPIEVVPARTPGFNRPPEPITAALDPPSPFSDSVIACRVDSPLLDDIDYDVLRYHYVWTVDGVVVRDVTHAGLADQLPKDTAATGQTVQCAVSVGDDDVFLEPVVVAALVDGTMHLAAPDPGLAGQQNILKVSDAQPQQRVYFAYGFQLGSTSVPGCAGLTSPIQSAQIGHNVNANAYGYATWTVSVPPGASGRTVYIQAAQPQSCLVSNLIGYTFL